MKRGQLAIVLVIVLLVAAVGAFIVFSDKSAGKAYLNQPGGGKLFTSSAKPYTPPSSQPYTPPAQSYTPPQTYTPPGQQPVPGSVYISDRDGPRPGDTLIGDELKWCYLTCTCSLYQSERYNCPHNFPASGGDIIYKSTGDNWRASGTVSDILADGTHTRPNMASCGASVVDGSVKAKVYGSLCDEKPKDPALLVTWLIGRGDACDRAKSGCKFEEGHYEKIGKLMADCKKAIMDACPEAKLDEKDVRTSIGIRQLAADTRE
jgi:hypothetical protein